MVRYPHTAVITNDAGCVTNGEWNAGINDSLTIQGRFEYTNTNSIIRKNQLGNEMIVHGRFFTSVKGLPKSGKLVISSKGVSEPIINSEEFSTHSIIYI